MKISRGVVITQKKVNLAQRILPMDKFRTSVFDMMDKVTLLFTNMQGPPEQVTFFGGSVTKIGFYVPALVGLCFGIVSYNGRVFISICADAEVVKDPQVLADGFVEEMTALGRACDAGVGPAPRRWKQILLRLLFTFASVLMFLVMSSGVGLLPGPGSAFALPAGSGATPSSPPRAEF
eukprot:NODE_1765_length_1067_cov_269.731225.p3 GENE.NODE_1765_length_1067_cov_269.731225~~NODE_1765_length_1067_cov_269.731225.p3  ORF type:complete len:178 (-),score=55.04 NODE_1765_length_1067_cov_269.731225:120-653(-)